MYKNEKTKYIIQTIVCVQVWYVQIWKENISMCDG